MIKDIVPLTDAPLSSTKIPEKLKEENPFPCGPLETKYEVSI